MSYPSDVLGEIYTQSIVNNFGGDKSLDREVMIDSIMKYIIMITLI